MPKKQSEHSKTILIVSAVVLVVLIVAGGIWQLSRDEPQTAPTPAPAPDKVSVSVKNQPVIDYNQLEKDKALGDMMDKRKADYGVGQGVDMIVTSDESVKIGDETVNMGEVGRKIQAKEGGITEQDLRLNASEQKDAYGIYVVQPGDNIWNIHFKLLKAYFAGRGVDIAPMADEPDPRGFSSGVGKLLKFSENLAYIYNVKERALTTDINVIQPLTKIVVYNMNKVFDLLGTIDYSKVHLIRFDGENLWIPAQQG